MIMNDINTMLPCDGNQTSTWPAHLDLKPFANWYAGYHGYLSLLVCSLGVPCNIINIIVLSQRNMRNSTNFILTALAVSDLLTMMSYIPFALQFYIMHGILPNPERNTHGWVTFFLFHVNFVVTTHTCSIWTGVLLSIFRYIYLTFPKEKSLLGTSFRVRIAIVAVYISSVLILVPNYMSLCIKPVTAENGNFSHYEVAPNGGYLVTVMNFWIHALLIKLIPCCLLSVFGVLLIYTLRDSNRKRLQLRRRSTLTIQTSKKRSTRSREHFRTTWMLVVVIVLFLITELPQGILALCSGLMPGFFEAYYMPLGDIMDMMALLNNGINFTLYCSMSKYFRDTFLHLFLPGIAKRQRFTRKLSLASNGQVSDYNIASSNRKPSTPLYPETNNAVLPEDISKVQDDQDINQPLVTEV